MRINKYVALAIAITILFFGSIFYFSYQGKREQESRDAYAGNLQNELNNSGHPLYSVTADGVHARTLTITMHFDKLDEAKLMAVTLWTRSTLREELHQKGFTDVVFMNGGYTIRSENVGSE